MKAKFLVSMIRWGIEVLPSLNSYTNELRIVAHAGTCMLTDVKLKRQVVASAGGTGEAVLRFRVEKSDAEIKLISKVAATKNFRAFPHSPPFLPVNVMCC